MKILTWQAVEALNGHVVSHYEVQRSANSWTTVADDVVGTMYVDMASETVNPAYRVRAVNIFDVPGPWSEPSAKRPGAPGGFSTSGSSDAQATLSWSAPDAVNGVTVTGYDVDFSQDGGNTWTSVATATGQPGTSFTHTDSSLAADTVRQYRVRAVSTVGSGSEQVVVKSDWAFAAATRDYLTPGAPRNFTARAINQSRVDLSWREPEAVADVSLTGYHLEFSTDGNTWNWLPAGQTRTVLSATTTSHEHTDDTLAPGALRQYRVRAVGTGAGNADFESVWVFANAATEAVGQPQNLAATADGRGRIDLTWDQPGFGAGRVTGYRIDYTPASPESWQTLEHGYRTSPRRYEHTGLKPGQQYCYQVAATYAGGVGPFAARACATTEGAPADLPGEPENLRVTQVGRNFVKLAWDKPSVGGEAEYYEWQSNVHEPREVKPGTATGVTVIGLAPGSNYEFQVRAGNSYGHSEWSRSIQVTLNLTGHSVKVSTQELEVEKGGSGSFNVSLIQAPRWPLLVYFHSIGPECLTEGLVYQQHRILLPTNPMYPSKEFWEDAWWGPPEDRYALPWNEGLDLQIDASLCQGGETTVVEPIFNSLPFSELEGLPMWEELGLDEEDWREKWGVDRLDGTTGPSVKVTVTDDGSGTGTQ
ncbi:MAG: fibronectin type III domain-containing protein [Chloroflexi bacterium]|nr:fibronectin type III domain-containing protein [Chloroflexota bacterium]